MVFQYRWLLVMLLFSVDVFAETKSRSIKVIEPKKVPVPVKSASIDTEKFQVGAYLGFLSVEDFNSNPIRGLSFSYQIADSYLISINHGIADVERSTFERREELNFIRDDQRTLTYTLLQGGYRLFTARSFIGNRFKYDSDIYLFGGVGVQEYAGEKGNGFSFGASYRVVFTDWMVVSLDFRDHLFKTKNLFGLESDKMTQNIELSIGVNALF